MSIKKKTLINVLGAGRSGTTMLDLMLGNDKESFSMGEVHAMFRPFRTHHFAIDCNCEKSDCEYWLELQGLSPNKFLKQAFENWKTQFIIDSSKNLTWIMDTTKWAKYYEIDIINFIIYKPITNYIYSIWKRGENVEDALYRYKIYYQRFFESGLDAYAINYNDLTRNTDDVLGALTTITKQPINSERSLFWKKEHHHLFGSGGVRKQVGNHNSALKKNEDFPMEFKIIIKEMEEKIAQDDKLNEILCKLENLDFKKGHRRLNNSSMTIKPFWYYFLKTKQLYYSHFPLNYTRN